MSDIAKVKRGDLVVVESPARSEHGTLVILAAGKVFFEAVPAHMERNSQRSKLLVADIAVHIAGTAGPALPAASGMDLDTPPPAKVEVTTPAEQLPSPEFVRIRVTQPQPSYRLDFSRGRKSVEYKPVAHGRDRVGQPTADFIVEKAHAALLARGDVAVELLEDPLGSPIAKADR